MIDLKAQFGSDYKITLDESAEILDQTTEERLWLYQIPAKYGHFFMQGINTLGAYVKTSHDSTDRLGRLLAIPGAKLLQRGDHEASVAFNPEYITHVAEIIKAKRRRRLSEARRQEAIDRLASHRFAPRTSAPVSDAPRDPGVL